MATPEETEDLPEFDLEDILNEFHDPDSDPIPVPEDVPPVPETEPEEAGDDAGTLTADPDDLIEQRLAEAAESAPSEPVPETEGDETGVLVDTGEVSDPDNTLRLEDLAELNLEDTDKSAEEAPAAEPEPQPEKKPPIPFNLRDMKKKQVAGPEKRYYDLTEAGVGRLQVAVLVSLVIFALSAAACVLHALDLVPANRMKLLIFSQILGMLLTGLLGNGLMIDSIAAIFKGRFSPNMLLTLTFLACCADAVFCLQEQRLPCCAAFSLEMTAALWARLQRRTTEISQMDTLRKAPRLYSLVREPDYLNGNAAFLKGNGDVDDFMDTYQAVSAPERLQNVFAFISLILCLGAATIASLRHGPSTATLVLANALLAAAPASAFLCLSRPAGILQKRLHMVGTVLCGWQGVKKLCAKSVYPLKDSDLFPKGSTKLNGVKFYSEREPEEIVSYASSVMIAADSSLSPLFRHLLTERGCSELPVQQLQRHDGSGYSAVVEGEAVLVGSLEFMQDCHIPVPEGTTVSQAVYIALSGELCAVIALSFAKMRSTTAGLVSLFGNRRLTPVLATDNFLVSPDFIQGKYGVKTRRLVCPDGETLTALAQHQADPESDVLALMSKDDLISAIYAVNGAKALKSSSWLGVIVHMVAGITGILVMLALAYLGSTELLTPIHVLLYQLIWLIPGLLITEWTRSV